LIDSTKGDMGKSKTDEREEKRQQRQKEIQQKREARKTTGGMKLGAKKITSD
jgi:hypothetical protein